ncbi:MAG: quinone-dependent dihydroorotate dehydrogenase [Segetibacter sp.]|jgi:dihydroorotate dehydrogenase|nr:quinone-dependent dihydroorotate dehydrogenase [Segetibacter sp.]
MYPLLRNILFNFDAEDVHHFSMSALHYACKINFIKSTLTNSFNSTDASLHKTVFDLPFKNPVGLGAGFDKNALYINELETFGFGFVEIGTVTPKPQAGNDRPRLFRLSKDKALINRMGFNNDGVKAIAARLRGRKRNIIIGGNIGKNKATDNNDAWKDYEACYNELFDCVDYFVINVSSPNTAGLRELQEKTFLQRIFSNLQNINAGKINPKPLLLKIAPDLTVGQLDDIIELAYEVQLSGLVATNTTISREGLQTDAKTIKSIGAGGLSGAPVKEKSAKIVQYFHQQTNGTIPIIASGGIFTGKDAVEKFKAGASLVQVWTGFVYEGPGIIQNICEHLVNTGSY